MSTQPREIAAFDETQTELMLAMMYILRVSLQTPGHTDTARVNNTLVLVERITTDLEGKLAAVRRIPA